MGGQAALSSCSAAIAIVGVMIASYIVGARHGRLQQQQQQQRQEEEDYHHRKVVLDGRNNDIVGLDEEVIESKQLKMQQRISARAESRIFFRSLSNNHHEETKGGSSNVTAINDNSSSINNKKDEMTFQIDRHTKQHVNDDDDDEVCIVEVICPMECISRVKSAAEIKNEIIVISDDGGDDDDDDDDDETVTHATPTPTRGVKIKIEPNNYNANVASTMNYKSKTNNSVHPSSSSSSISILPPIQPVATLSSVYRLCVGTPRQGMLVPTSRGIITFDSNIVSRDSILELEGYSHVYVLFAFHLNNNLSSSTNSDSNNTGGGKGEGDSISKTTKKRQQHQFTSKIAPPSLGGKKVGIFATRTPHRPNPIGISLCKLDRVIINQGYGGGDVTMKGGGKKSKKFNKNNSNHNNNSSFMLLLSGLDLVDGTPILDIKPYVPHYDCVGYADQQLNGNTTPAATATLNAKTITHGNDIDDSISIVNNNSILHNQTLSLSSSSTVGKEGGDDDHSHVKVPYWVESGLQKRRNVTLLPKAKQFLHQYQDLVSSVIIDGCNNKSEEEIPTSSSLSSSSLLLQRLQFYGTHTPWNDTPQYAIQCLERCIIDTLSCDVRSAWQTDKARKGKFQAERSVRLGGGGQQQQRPQQSGSEGDDNNMNSNDIDNNDNDQPQRLCTQQIDNVLVSYTVGKSDQHIDERSEGSGAEDVVVVHTISFIE